MVIAPEWRAREDVRGGAAMKVRPGAVVRGAGVALACLAPDPSKRSPIMLAGVAGGWFLNRPGLQVFTIIPDANEPWKRATVPFATSVTSWSTLMLGPPPQCVEQGCPSPSLRLCSEAASL